MPANLPAEAKQKYREASLARNPEEKIKKLQEFMSLFPKHKGTENLRAQVKRKISLLKQEIEDKKQKRTGVSSGPRDFVEKEGDAQIVLLGPTNVGRSSLLSTLTNSKVQFGIIHIQQQSRHQECSSIKIYSCNWLRHQHLWMALQVEVLGVCRL